jgi:hypothetical protein
MRKGGAIDVKYHYYLGVIMQSALRITTTVLTGGKVELQLPPESVGDEIEIFVVLPEKKKIVQQSIFDFFDEIHRHGPFRTGEEIDRDLQEERDSWDS